MQLRESMIHQTFSPGEGSNFRNDGQLLLHVLIWTSQIISD